MIVFYDPTNLNQVMAVYSHGTDSVIWENLGYVMQEITDERHQRDIARLKRDSRLVFNGEVLAAVAPFFNPEQPIV